MIRVIAGFVTKSMGSKQKRGNSAACNESSRDDCYDLSLSETTNLKNMQEIISEEIVDQCRLNDRKAQRIVYEKLFPSSMRVCKRYCSSHEEAMEVLNSGFLKVFTQINQFGQKGSFEGWVHRIMVNSCLNYLRAEKKFHDHHLVLAQIQDISVEEDLEIQDYADISLEKLYELIHELPPASRMVFNLFVFENYSHDEIGKELNISAGTSKWHLSNARNMLQQKIKMICQQIQL